MNEVSPNYQLVEALTPGRTYLCVDVSDNLMILKTLDADCLHREQLHPAILDRLARIRELAHPHVAALRTVERWNGQACVVWVYVPGQNWNQTMRESSANVDDLKQRLSDTVATLHELGIVHGNLHGGNIIVEAGHTAVWLTDFSPYLYVDPQVDVDAVKNLLPPTFETTSSSINLLQQEDLRTGPLIMAGIFVLLIVITFVTVRWSVSVPRETLPASFPSLRH